MKRGLATLAAILFMFVIAAPSVAAAEPVTSTGRILISTEGDVTLPADETADMVMVIDGTATIEGEVDTVIAIDGAATLVGGRATNVVAINSHVTIGPGSVVAGDISQFDSSLDRAADARVGGRIVDLRAALISIGAVLAPALFLFWIGFGVAMLVAALLVVALASRQVRAAEALISNEPVSTLVAGLVGLVVMPVMAVILIVTIVGAPLGFGILFQLWPLLAFLGYLVAGTWVGEWLLRKLGDTRVRERPYLPAFIGVLILQVLSLVPVLAIVAMIASFFGFGAVLLLAWRTFHAASVPQASITGPAPAPVAG